MAVPKLSNILGTLDTIATRVENAVPVIRSTVTQIQTIASGKSPQPAPSQQPATVQELVPRNVGQLDASVAAGGISGALLLGGLAVLAILFFAVKRR